MLALYKDVLAAIRADEGVISCDIARDILNPDAFVGTEVFTDQSALDRTDTLPEVARVYGHLDDYLVAPPEATIFQVASAQEWAG